MNNARAIRKLEIAIDKMVDLQDGGYGCDAVTRILEMLNSQINAIRCGTVHH